MILKTHDNYAIGVKKNQMGLYKQAGALTAQGQAISGRFTGLAKNKGRIERGGASVSNAVQEIGKGWTGLK